MNPSEVRDALNYGKRVFWLDQEVILKGSTLYYISNINNKEYRIDVDTEYRFNHMWFSPFKNEDFCIQ